MTNVIARRIYDFLKDYPPFSLLDAETLERVSERVVVQYRRPGEVIFRRGEKPGSYIYMVRDGAVQLFDEAEGDEVLVEQCDEGDVFGIRPLLAEDDYALTARAVEETLLYAVNIEGFQRLISENPRIAYYLASNMAAGLRRRTSPTPRLRMFMSERLGPPSDFRLMELYTIERAKEPVTCGPDRTMREAAEIMTRERVSSIIVVNEERHPLGILTDYDLRSKIATGRFPLETPVRELMSSPVVTIEEQTTVAGVQIAMLKGNIHHLCITADGTADSPVIGVISEHDLLVLQGNNPAVIIREIRRGKTADQLRTLRERAEGLLRQYLHQEVAIAFIATIMTEINDEIIRRCLVLAEAELKKEGQGEPPVPYCWLALGSEGRGEQLLRTDQDNALVFTDVPEADHAAVQAYFLQLAQRVVDHLYKVGFDYCPGEMMANNPKWCMSLERWKAQFSQWIFEPSAEAIMHTSIFFDYRPVYGEARLAGQLTGHIFEAIGDQHVFLAFLAKDALQNPPPLTFFRNFVIESSGEHKNAFDIKARAMMPLTDAARVLILEAKVGKINNTFRRFEKLAELDPKNHELFLEAADAYEILLRLRTLQGLRNNDTGRYFDPAQLSKMERIHLRNAFRPIKELQALLNVRFQLAYFR